MVVTPGWSQTQTTAAPQQTAARKPAHNTRNAEYGQTDAHQQDEVEIKRAKLQAQRRWQNPIGGRIIEQNGHGQHSKIGSNQQATPHDPPARHARYPKVSKADGDEQDHEPGIIQSPQPVQNREQPANDDNGSQGPRSKTDLFPILFVSGQRLPHPCTFLAGFPNEKINYVTT